MFLLHPFDARSVQLVISLLAKEPALVRYFAALLIPDEKKFHYRISQMRRVTWFCHHHRDERRQPG